MTGPCLRRAESVTSGGMYTATTSYTALVEVYQGERVIRRSSQGATLVTLFSRTERIPSFPQRPKFRALLSDAKADAIIHRATVRLGYRSL